MAHGSQFVVTFTRTKIYGVGILIFIAFFGSLTLLASFLAHVDAG